MLNQSLLVSIKPTNRFIIAMIPLFLLGIIVFSSCLSTCGKHVPVVMPPSTPPAANEVTVYFSKSRGTDTVTEGVVRQMPETPAGTPGASIIRLHNALDALLQGPTPDESVTGFFSEIPKGTRLLGISEKGGQLHVNLSKQFTSGGGSNSIKQRVAELTQTITSTASNKEPVVVDVEGQRLDTAGGEGLEVDQPVNTGNPR